MKACDVFGLSGEQAPAFRGAFAESRPSVQGSRDSTNDSVQLDSFHQATPVALNSNAYSNECSSLDGNPATDFNKEGQEQPVNKAARIQDSQAFVLEHVNLSTFPSVVNRGVNLRTLRAGPSPVPSGEEISKGNEYGVLRAGPSPAPSGNESVQPPLKVAKLSKDTFETEANAEANGDDGHVYPNLRVEQFQGSSADNGKVGSDDASEGSKRLADIKEPRRAAPQKTGAPPGGALPPSG